MQFFPHKVCKSLPMAKKFKFRLESVLRYREILKEVQEGKLMQANRACQETEEAIAAIDRSQDAVYESMIDNVNMGFRLQDQLNLESFNHLIIHDRSKEKTRLAKRRKAQEFEQEKYVRLSKQLKMVEKLKDKALNLHQKDFLDQEMKQIDDLVNSRYRAQD